jgi:nucleotide-binding universal stress UspA family protein
MFSTIVLALDGSASSERAIRLLGNLASPGTARIEIVHVKELVAARGGPQTVKADEAEVVGAVKARANEIAESGFETHLHIESTVSGGPAHVIAAVAERVGGDLIVIATRGHSPVAGLLVGSVTTRLLHIAPCPVLAIPASVESADAPAGMKSAAGAAS